MTERHSTVRDGKRLVWYTERLWSLARDLEPFEKRINEIPELDIDCWFGADREPTVRAVIEHARRILEADLDHPIILNADGSLMDGGHRLGKALLEGRETIAAVQFATMPEPDVVIDSGV